MKTKIFIIALLIASLLGAFALKASAQDTSEHKELIADETYLKFYKADAKITTTLESVFMDISLKFGNQFKKIMITYKQANGHPYKEYVITISTETATNIKEWAKTNL